MIRCRLAFAHGGGAFPGTIGRIAHGWEARPDLCAVGGARHPREYLGHFYLDSLVHDADALLTLIRLLGEERVALGSDYPFPLGEAEPLRLSQGLAVDEVGGVEDAALLEEFDGVIVVAGRGHLTGTLELAGGDAAPFGGRRGER